MFKIHGVRPSPFTRKVLVLLEEKEFPYELCEVSPLPKTDGLLAMNPLGLVPVLEHNGRFIPDSSVICAYVERLHPDRPMYPADTSDYAEALFLEEYADTHLMGSIGPVFGERFVKVHVTGGTPDEAVVQKAMSEGIPPAFEYLEGRLEADRETFLDNFSVADAAMGSVLACLNLAGEKIDPGRWPRLASYHNSLLGRASFRVATPSG